MASYTAVVARLLHTRRVVAAGPTGVREPPSSISVLFPTGGAVKPHGHDAVTKTYDHDKDGPMKPNEIVYMHIHFPDYDKFIGNQRYGQGGWDDVIFSSRRVKR